MHATGFDKFISIVRSPIFLVIWLILMVISYFFFDKGIAFYFQPHDTWLYTFSTWITPFGYPTYYVILFIILSLIGYIWATKTRMGICSLFVLTSLITTAIVQNILKVLLGKARPEVLFDTGQFGFFFLQTTNPFWSIPSGLITTMTGLLLSLAFVFPRYGLWFVAVLVLASLTRLVVTVHFLFDVMASLYIMFMVVIWLHDLFKRKGWLKPREEAGS